ncbi:hypothetical protein SAMN02927914_01390 [Mesorhizobium qingshengii]|uniref:Uncharacterized protein n=1 Tax=Mesorhizobium qingshengii TaxID=1165689 RepID=A0A1G5WK42_9HYPH|nr:hypothetical protein SAMN02927914_01390 [Mesorhizobium qingshengii]
MEFTLDKAPQANVPIEHSPISDKAIWLLTSHIHEVCERLYPFEH